MKLKSTFTVLALGALSSSVALGITISKPVANSSVPANTSVIEVVGACRPNLHVKLDGTDSSGKVTSLIWAMCTGNSNYWAQVPMSAMAAGNVSIRAFQVYNNVTEQVRVNVVKQGATASSAKISIYGQYADSQVTATQAKIALRGACRPGLHVKLDGTDSAGKTTSLVWAMCTGVSDYWAEVPMSAMAAGGVSIRAFQVYNGVTEEARIKVVKQGTGVVVTPSPVPTATATATATVSPSPTATVSPTTPPVSSSGVVFGVNGHDGRQYYPLAQSEATFKMLSSRNLRSYRFDIDPRNYTVLDELVRLSKIYNITLRPMVYPMSYDIAYALAKRYGNSIKVWEIGNEQDYSKAGAQGRMNTITNFYKGMKKASDEMGAGLKFTINLMACNSDDKSANARCPGDRNGAMWWLDMAKATGFNFDYISFHYYPYLGDKGYWMDMYLGQMRAQAKKYNTKVFFNETNCANVYQGNTTGGYPGDGACYDSVKQILSVIKTSYSDVVAEVNMYELYDQKNIEGVEGHFGLMYNTNSAKPTLDLLTSFAK